MTRNYREAYGLFAVNGILFNHESPRRGETFVTRKISMAAARIKLGLQSELYLGNLDAIRDWGYAPEYVYAMWKMLQAPSAEDFVIATGRAATVREFLTYAFSALDLEWEQFVKFDNRYFRPTEVDALIGDASKAGDTIGWSPNVLVAELAEKMVAHDFDALRSGGHVVDRPVFHKDLDLS
jgi:GDPmannose 4,6-dehydratase